MRYLVLLVLLLMSCTLFSHLPPTRTQVPSAPPVTSPPASPTVRATSSPIPPTLTPGQPTPAALPDQIGGITVHYLYDKNTFFPEEWQAEPISCSGKQFDLAEAPRTVSDLEEFISAYDPEFISRNLADIYLMDDLQCYGSPYGGTNGWDSLYFTIGPESEGYTDQFLISIFHGEFSSILMRNYSFPHEAWNSVNEAGFTYSENDVQVVGQEDMRFQSEELLQRGFLYLYSTTSEENDFNLFAEEFFTNTDELCSLRAKYERINRKAELAMGFYESIGSGADIQPCQE